MMSKGLAKVLHTCAISLVVVSGTCAFAALAVGSPLQFGVALALCGAGWIAVDYIGTIDRRRSAPRRALPAVQVNPGYGSLRVVYVGGGEPRSLAGPATAPRTRRESAVRVA
ncbi:hypothetical protein [Mycobacterium sp. 050134]|uniref:hypothetical protein n=1 Tax=Mycobacterium sp. 050134 TaxID=3096111 RepID=UPI002ED85857